MDPTSANAFPQPPRGVIDRLGVQVDGYLGGRAHRQWLVSGRSSAFVLRRYPAEPLGDVSYELSVVRRLKSLGWPVPAPVEDAFDMDGRIWCLFDRLPGAPQTIREGRAEHRQRGRLLAELHADTETLVDLGQRGGWRSAEAVAADPELRRALDAYQHMFPEPAHILRWHADRAHERFESLDLRDRQLIVLHGDFVARNLLYQDGRLTGIVDFEGTHLNHRASEFALAWQGKRDDVIVGYEQVLPLDELDRALLAPTLWSWVLLGVADQIQRITSGLDEPHGFDWQIDRLLRRSPLMGPDATPYANG